MNNLNKMLDYIQKENEYRKRYKGKIEDTIINNVHINDIYIFPSWWYSLNDINTKDRLLTKALKENKSLSLIDEGLIIEQSLKNIEL